VKATLKWRKTRAGYTLLEFNNVLLKEKLPVEYTNRHGPKYWHYAPGINDIVYYADSRERKIAVGMVLSPDEWEYVMKVLVDAGERLADVRNMVEAGEEITLQV